MIHNPACALLFAICYRLLAIGYLPCDPGSDVLASKSKLPFGR